MADEQMQATFDDYVTGGHQVTTDALPADPTGQPGGAAVAQAAEKPPVATPPRNEQGQFTKAGAPVAEAAPATPSAPDQEAAARALGWKPLEEFGGDPRKWVEARVWVENAPLVSQIKSYKQQLRERNKAIEAAQLHYSRVHEAAYQRAVQDLTEQKKQAIVEQDVARVEEIDRSIAQVSAERLKAPTPQPTYDPAYKEWIEDNPTIVGDPALKAFAIAYEQTLMTTEPDIEARLDKTTQAVRAAFPDRFKNVRRQAPSLVEGNGNGANAGNGARKFGVADLNADERAVMARLVNSGLLTQDQYLKDIQETRTGAYTLDIN